ncbi:glucocorticoid-induced transcript 1 protein-like isoform X2 [Mugil cephalus]|uniref:glucocorticoid-induced transcript 1 protein-like isoform X2 n=1 Tax=Mugil cephalus TaxID=48193 RepID=UPI001FB73ABD|nr:glucocorticoid-induced transcript 1 protein-like isoform X2 [Mugil cephalus]
MNMSGRSGAAGPSGVRGPGLGPGPQPLKATVPYHQLARPRPSRREAKPAGKTKSHQLSSGMRRTMSLDAIVGPYLQGHWPKEPEDQSGLSREDKATQTPDSWTDSSQSWRGSHKRSASWGSAEHLKEIAKLKQQLQQCSKPAASGGRDKESQRGNPPGSCSLGATQTQPIPIPLATLVPRLRCSVEGLNQELEGMFISQPPHPQQRLLEVPDGHRAPVPLQSCSSGSQSDAATTPLSSSSTSSSPCSSPSCTGASQPSAADAPAEQHLGVSDGAELRLPSPFSPQTEADVSLPLLISSSPGPNKSCCFQREPPEGCEKVRVWEEISSLHQPKPAQLISSCPDPNKVNFTPHGTSAFCPVSLLKPLLPSMDLLFRSLAVSPASSCCSGGQGSGSGSGPRASPQDPPPPPPPEVGETSGEGLAF